MYNKVFKYDIWGKEFYEILAKVSNITTAYGEIEKFQLCRLCVR